MFLTSTQHHSKGGWPLGFYFDRAIAEIMSGESKEFSVAEAGGAFVHAGGYDGYPRYFGWEDYSHDSQWLQWLPTTPDSSLRLQTHAVVV